MVTGSTREEEESHGPASDIPSDCHRCIQAMAATYTLGRLFRGALLYRGLPIVIIIQMSRLSHKAGRRRVKRLFFFFAAFNVREKKSILVTYLVNNEKRSSLFTICGYMHIQGLMNFCFALEGG